MEYDELDIDKFCKTKFSVPITSWFSWDDALNIMYFLLNLTIVLLATVNTIKSQKNEISQEESKRILLSQKIIKLLAGVFVFFIGCYNVFIFFNVISYSASNRSIVGMTQILLGIVFIILASYSFTQ